MCLRVTPTISQLNIPGLEWANKDANPQKGAWSNSASERNTAKRDGKGPKALQRKEWGNGGSRAQVRGSRRLCSSLAPELPPGPVLWELGAHSLYTTSGPTGTLSAASWQCFPFPSLKGKAELQGQRAGKVSSSHETNKNWSNLNWVTCQVCLLQMHSLSLYDRCPHSQSVSAELISPDIPPQQKLRDIFS